MLQSYLNVLAQEELPKSQKRYKKHYDKKAKPRHLEVEDQVLILFLTDSNKLLMQWTIHCVESCESQRLQSKDGAQDKDVPGEYVEEVYC